MRIDTYRRERSPSKRQYTCTKVFLFRVSIVNVSLDAKVLNIQPDKLEHLLLTDKICFSKVQSEDINIPKSFILSCWLIILKSGLT